ncbi:MAG: hypothetical protein FD155_706 [Bacteroidetes bacterium]|nr:MAG: hypothetical protein FD155_706 [Bacteroidota bacterium]
MTAFMKKLVNALLFMSLFNDFFNLLDCTDSVKMLFLNI